MKDRDARYKLKHFFVMDDSCFGSSTIFTYCQWKAYIGDNHIIISMTGLHESG